MGNAAGKENRDAVSVASAGSGRRRRSSTTVSLDSTSSADAPGLGGRLPSASSLLGATPGAAAMKASLHNVLNSTEMVDGGYLVTQGVYTGPQDYKARIVRQLQIERKLAPFFKGLNDYEESWADNQVLAAIKGQPIPPPETSPPPAPAVGLTLSAAAPSAARSRSQSNVEPSTYLRELAEQTDAAEQTAPAGAAEVPAGAEAAETAAEPAEGSLAGAHASSLSLASSHSGSSPSSHFGLRPKMRSRTNTVSSSSVPRQNNDVLVYRGATECPICFLYYPPYLNSTRCCDQPICSECFVQMKRADPHPPSPPSSPGPDQEPAPAAPSWSVQAGMPNLISEPTTCPYCNEPDFGVTYTPPPFRSGLGMKESHKWSLSSTSKKGLTALMPSSVVSSTTSVNSGSSESSTGRSGRRRASLPASAAEVVTTDRIRPDWALKLANARAHLARRSAAATALHSAAFLIAQQSSEPRRNRSGSSGSRRGLPFDVLFGAGGGRDERRSEGHSARAYAPRRSSLVGAGAEAGTSPRRLRRLADLEEMMVMEAIRISLLEDERRQAEGGDESPSRAVAEPILESPAEESAAAAEDLAGPHPARAAPAPATPPTEPVPVQISASPEPGPESTQDAKDKALEVTMRHAPSSDAAISPV
ncbi:uncharacterized protein V1510DRAFT_422096 [Dipodascopsis tothii]|uniref:uncharacterized protein n=1 Tax=Dipodascopsis tothii TaxID=44089 RepID=UPI0034CE57B5